MTEELGDTNFSNEICYTGAVYDASTALYYLNARYYDPENGRFLTEDTYRGELDKPETWHLYAYCANNPVNYTDPSGHSAVAIAFTKITKKTKKKMQIIMNKISVKFDLKLAKKAIDAANAQAKGMNRIKKHLSKRALHHIVPKGAKRSYHAVHARNLLEGYGMDVKKDKRNLVSILKAMHVGLHTNVYYQGVDLYLSKKPKNKGLVFSRLYQLKRALIEVSNAIERLCL